MIKINPNTLPETTTLVRNPLSLSHSPMESSNNLLTTHVIATMKENLRFLILLFVIFVETLLLIQQKWKQQPILILLSPIILSSILNHYLSKNPPQIYLVDFSCLKPPNFCRIPFSSFLEHVSMIDTFTQESVTFMEKVLHSSGQCEQTYLPPPLHYIPPRTHHQESIKEVHMLLFPIMDDLMFKTNLSPTDLDILIVNCSGFCPSPSLSSIVVNKYKMRSDIKTYNISGMGCSAGSLAVDLARNLLEVHKNCNAVVLSTEILSTGWYSGNERSMLLLNCHFRMGGAGVLLTNRKEARKSSKYKLFRTIRTHNAFNDKAYTVVFREEDSLGLTGVTLNRDSLQVAEEVIRNHLTLVGSSILPLSEKLRHAFSLIWNKFIDKSMKIYVPDFRSSVQHFCLPTSGQQVIKEIAKGIKLSEKEMEAALMTLHRFGNQSSSALWYELAYIEGKERVKKGDKVWQLGMGSGTKCNSVIWECIRPIVGESIKGPWADCIDDYPIKPR